MKVFADASESIGRTPLVRLHNLDAGLGGKIYGKIEGRNPAYSVKCRIAAGMIWDAEKRGLLKPGGTIVEPTSRWPSSPQRGAIISFSRCPKRSVSNAETCCAPTAPN